MFNKVTEKLQNFSGKLKERNGSDKNNGKHQGATDRTRD